MEISNITRTLNGNVESTFPISHTLSMVLTKFDEPTPQSPYYRIYFEPILSGDFDLADVDYDAFGDPWTDTINMGIVDGAVVFGLNDGLQLRWFPYKTYKTFPQSVQDPESPEYEDINRYNDLIDSIMVSM